jgi:hypothetical protein
MRQPLRSQASLVTAVLEYDGTTGTFVRDFVGASDGGLSESPFITFGPPGGDARARSSRRCRATADAPAPRGVSAEVGGCSPRLTAAGSIVPFRVDNRNRPVYGVLAFVVMILAGGVLILATFGTFWFVKLAVGLLLGAMSLWLAARAWT